MRVLPCHRPTHPSTHPPGQVKKKRPGSHSRKYTRYAGGAAPKNGQKEFLEHALSKLNKLTHIYRPARRARCLAGRLIAGVVGVDVAGSEPGTTKEVVSEGGPRKRPRSQTGRRGAGRGASWTRTHPGTAGIWVARGGGLHPWAQGGGQQLRVEADDAGVGSGGRPSGLKRGGGPQLDPGVGRAAPWGVADTLSSQADSDTKLLARLVPAKSLLP